MKLVRDQCEMTWNLMNRIVEAPDDRKLRVHEAGDPGGRPVLFRHGGIMFGLPYEPLGEDAW